MEQIHQRHQERESAESAKSHGYSSNGGLKSGGGKQHPDKAPYLLGGAVADHQKAAVDDWLQTAEGKRFNELSKKWKDDDFSGTDSEREESSKLEDRLAFVRRNAANLLYLNHPEKKEPDQKASSRLDDLEGHDGPLGGSEEKEYVNLSKQLGGKTGEDRGKRYVQAVRDQYKKK